MKKLILLGILLCLVVCSPKIVKSIILIGSGAVIGGEHYPGEEDNRVAVWRFEDDPGFTVDTEGTNTLTNNGVDEETTLYKQGTKCAAFVLAKGQRVDAPAITL